ncbi:MAG: hypothetical protein WCC21_09495 [Candidatus Acidiferrales bacterium]
MKPLSNIVAGVLCTVALGAPALRAQPQAQDQSQQQTPDQTQQQSPAPQGPTQPAAPIPAYRSPLAGAANNEDEDTNPEITPDNRSLTGVLPLGLGMPNEHSYWQPHFDVFLTVDSNPTETTGKTSWDAWTSLDGGVNVHKVSGNNDLELTYVGGGEISSESSVSNGVIQQLVLTDKITFRRWALTFLDETAYLPESSFGFGGVGGGGLPGGGSLGGGVGTLGTGQSLLVGRGQNIGNSFDAEADVQLTPRSSLTFVGGYSLLDYFDSDLLNYGTVNARAGYNYQIDRKDTLGLSYTFSDISYSNFDQSVVAHTFQASYGRRVTGRLAFQVSAGPQLVSFTTPITPGTAGSGGTGESGGTSSGPTTDLYWSLSASLTYAQRRTSYQVAYSHGVAGGAGVLAGADVDQVNGSITRQMTRKFSSGFTGGYSRNQGLAVFGTTSTTPTSQTFDYWFGGGNFSYPIGRALALTFTYQLQYQNSGTAFCIGTPCASSLTRNMFSVGLDWLDRPHRF